ncbi:hypothetical protein C4D60_Mb08t21480 [Musa balbisiana]|uniref:Uncharacterized protein n=1 Tax=Musa balbisiana TaxID=52838 RepID=A0A4S8K5J6_MUSBA|nr:hypothetical protein C4D60_Mb08t21480 [Musa balbisiana]
MDVLNARNDSSTEEEEACVQKEVEGGTTQAGDQCTRRMNSLPTKMKPCVEPLVFSDGINACLYDREERTWL